MTTINLNALKSIKKDDPPKVDNVPNLDTGNKDDTQSKSILQEVKKDIVNQDNVAKIEVKDDKKVLEEKPKIPKISLSKITEKGPTISINKENEEPTIGQINLKQNTEVVEDKKTIDVDTKKQESISVENKGEKLIVELETKKQDLVSVSNEKEKVKDELNEKIKSTKISISQITQKMSISPPIIEEEKNVNKQSENTVLGDTNLLNKEETKDGNNKNNTLINNSLETEKFDFIDLSKKSDAPEIFPNYDLDVIKKEKPKSKWFSFAKKEKIIDSEKEQKELKTNKIDIAKKEEVIKNKEEKPKFKSNWFSSTKKEKIASIENKEEKPKSKWFSSTKKEKVAGIENNAISENNTNNEAEKIKEKIIKTRRIKLLSGISFSGIIIIIGFFLINNYTGVGNIKSSVIDKNNIKSTQDIKNNATQNTNIQPSNTTTSKPIDSNLPVKNIEEKKVETNSVKNFIRDKYKNKPK